MLGPRLRLSPSELEVIREVILRRAPDLASLVDRLSHCPVPSTTLSDEEAGDIASVLCDEFVENLDENSEPNEYGRRLDTIIGVILFRG